MEQRLTKLWYRDSAGPSLLQPLAWLEPGHAPAVRVAAARWAHVVGGADTAMAAACAWARRTFDAAR